MITLYTKRSDIHGKGCFASGHLRPATEFVVPSREVKVESLHSVTADEDGRVYELYSPFKFINHSDDPNAELYSDDGTLTLYILREVAPHEEITIHYGDDWSD